MKKKFAMLVALTLAAGAFSVSAKEEAAASKPDHQKMMKHVEKINGQVAKVEGNISSLTRKEVMLKPDSLKGVTDEKWSKLHAYSDKGGTIRRLRVYPMKGSEKTEEFYYNKGNLMFVFLEKNGADKEGHDANAKGTKYYFDKSGLFAVIEPDGSMMHDMDAKTKVMGEKLQRESKALRDAAK